jgi:HAD superfamily hydrolase (TIGR01509 family)
MQIEAVVFDFDGLMIESERIALRVWKEVVAALGRDMDDEVNVLIIGKAPDVAATIVKHHLELSISSEDLRNTYWEQRTIEMCEEAQAVDGLEALINYLIERDLPLGVASNSPSPYVERVLEAIQLRKYIECVVGSDQVQSGKPAPDVYLEAADQLGIRPEATLALEDSPTGVAAAIRAGMTCFAIPNHELVGEDFSMAQMLFNSMPELHEYLKDIFAD